MIDVEEIRTKLVQDYRSLWIDKHKYEINDDEVNINNCSSKMNYIVEILMFITGWSREAAGESLASHLNYIITFNPQNKPENWELDKFDSVELKQDIYYNDLATMLEDWETTEQNLIREGFKIVEDESYKAKWVVIPEGTIMTFQEADCNGWPEFEVRMRITSYYLTFAGDPFKVKLI